MYTIDLNTPIHVHFIGIGGISMSGLAEILIKRNFTITGSDVGVNKNTQKLTEQGAVITKGHMAENITDAIDLVVYTVAVKDDNVEIQAAKQLNLPIINRATLLGQIMDGYKDSVAVSGTHGKTTTTSMVAHILDESGTDPTVSVGGILPLIDGNIGVGHSSYFVTEACEYYDSFHHFRPEVAIVLNVEEDHMDYFKDIHQIRRSFNTFLMNMKEGGRIIIHQDIEALEQITQNTNAIVTTYSASNTEADYYASNISYNELGHPSFTIIHNGQAVTDISLSVPGLHNVGNAIAAFIVGVHFELDQAAVTRGLKAFGGTHRRFQYKGSLGGVSIVDDYAHHPTEIAANIQATKHMAIGKLWIAFQPHTYTRTIAFLDEFAEALAGADHVILLDIYSAAREIDTGEVHSKDLQKKILDLGTPCEYFETFDEIEYFVMTHAIPKDLLITMGAGDVYLLGEKLLEQ